ncbi:MAG: hypothetical protein LBT05_05480 [Planctomycetaceae bacterium]|jgi:uncharacterized protein YndB with AHSA1/START domain|nr:hypothetical protein [Planctomycetaceae bacterium]
MKINCSLTLVFTAIFGVITVLSGCNKAAHDHSAGKEHSHQESAAGQESATGHDSAHKPKYNEVIAEFPGHKYAMEIIDEKETTGLVTAFVTDAHFEPVQIDANEVRLNFIVSGKPKTYTLTRTQSESGKPATFTLKDMELATMNCEGWEGEATATVEISGVPYTAKLVKLAHGEHNHKH